jgi:serine/threonine-protein kinase
MNSVPSSNYWNGRFIGDNQRYRIEKPLAAGGMGEVLLATDTRVGQQVVLKLLKDTLVASQEMRKRFEREIAVCAALQSDHIVKISDCGVTPEGYPFYVMEYLRGQTLRQLLLREQRLSVERTVKIISQVCQGLQLAHQGVTLQKDGSNEHIRVIHRDLKPDNIFLVPTDLGEWVKLLDFGVAKIRNDSSAEQTSLTNTFIGTFRYAAPEQIQNKQNLDARADIYSLGIILYEMLSAADPFGFSTKGSNISEASWVLAHAYEPPTPLRSQPGCEQLSPEIEAVVLKCLHKNPNNRFASVAELNQALQAASHSTTNNTAAIQEQNIVHPQPNFDQETVPRPLYPAEPSQPAYNQGLDNETVPRPLYPAEPSQPAYNQGLDNETVPRPLYPAEPSQPAYNQGLNNETVPRPLYPVESSQPPYNQGLNNETVPRPLYPAEPSQPAYNQGLNNETVPRPLQPIESEPPEGTIFQPRSSSHPGAGNNETVPRPLQPIESDQPEGTIFQPRSSSHPGVGNNETVPRPLQPTEPDQPEGTIFQIRSSSHPGAGNNETVPRPLQPTEPDQPEGTIFQIRSSSHPGAGNNDTVPRPLQPTEPNQPEGTIFQIRHSTHPDNNNDTAPRPPQPIEPEKPEGTIFQIRPSTHTGVNNNTDPRSQPPIASEQPTIFQPRSSSHASANNDTGRATVSLSDNTILQPKPDKVDNLRKSNAFKQNLLIGLALVLAFLGGMLIFHLQSNQDSNNSPIEPNSSQR